MRVRTQGSIGVSPAGATVIDKTDRIAYLSIELEDKWPYILHYSRAGFDEHWPLIALGETEDDMNPTKLEFPEFTGWTAHLVDVSKYTLMILLVNEDYWK